MALFPLVGELECLNYIPCGERQLGIYYNNFSEKFCVAEEEHPYAKVGGEPETDTDNYDEPRVVTGDMRLQRWVST